MAAAAGLLTLAQLQIAAQIQLLGHLVKALLAHQRCRIRVRSPSGRSGCRAKRYSAVTKPSTLSPKNSSRSLLPSPWERCSFA